jgi:hypothetical protein
MKQSLKLTLTTISLTILAACGGGGSGDNNEVPANSFLSVSNTGRGVVCINDAFVDAYSVEGQLIARDLLNYYGIKDVFANPISLAYSAPTVCGGPIANEVPKPDLIIDINFYKGTIVPNVIDLR